MQIIKFKKMLTQVHDPQMIETQMVVLLHIGTVHCIYRTKTHS
jgi:hypothetical protein